MKIIKKKKIEGKIGKLILLDDKKTVEVHYDNQVLLSENGNTWNNMKDEPWIIDGTLEMCVKNYIEEKEAFKRLEEIAKECFENS